MATIALPDTLIKGVDMPDEVGNPTGLTYYPKKTRPGYIEVNNPRHEAFLRKTLGGKDTVVGYNYHGTGWDCPNCGHGNWAWQEVCARCDQAILQ